MVGAVPPAPLTAAGGTAGARGLVPPRPSSLRRPLLATVESSARSYSDSRRTLRPAFVAQWLGKEERGQESRPDEPVIGRSRIAGRDVPLARFMGFRPNLDGTGDLEAMNLLAARASA
jgi:enoyl-[acyl-carrier protein] reductase II